MASIIAAVNAFQPKITGRKTSLSMAEKVKEGWWPGPAPVGYRNAAIKNSDSIREDRIILVDEVKGCLRCTPPAPLLS